jgi:hypothetical protein|tara:strand:- start:1071 stop:1610 length:540 start_codon:yes stop_codon:yes gene_type:complete
MLSTIYNFKIAELDINNLPTELFSFCTSAESQGMENNKSIEKMKFGRWDQDVWWCTWVNNKIVSISGCHRYNEYSPDCWRLMVRTATLKEYRGRAPGSIKQIKTDFNWGYILPYQVAYAKSHGAKKLIFTTNSNTQGDANSFRTNRVVSKVLAPQGLVKLIDTDIEIFYTKQNVWEIIT